MAEGNVDLRSGNFRQWLPWTELFRGFAVALDPRKLLLAAAGILVMSFGWWLLAVIFIASSKKPQPEDYLANTRAYEPTDSQLAEEKRRSLGRQLAWQHFKEDRRIWNLRYQAAGSAPTSEKEVEYLDAGDLADGPDEYEQLAPQFANINAEIADGSKTRAQIREEILLGKRKEAPRKWLDSRPKPYGQLRMWPFFEDRGPNPYLLVTGQTGIPWEAGHAGEWLVTRQFPVLIEPLVKFFRPVVFFLSPNAGFVNRFYFLLVILWTLATWAFFGGAITRMAAVELACNEKIGMGEAIRFVGSRYLSYLSAPLLPLGLVAAVVVGLMLFGIVAIIPGLGDIVLDGLLWPIPLLGGLVMAVVLVGLVGWPMMNATISAEGSDSFDAISRSYTYVFQGAWSYIWYCLVAVAYGAVVVFFVGFMGSLVVYLAKWGVARGQGLWAPREPSYLFVYAPTSFGWRDLLVQGATVDGNSVVVNGQIVPELFEKYYNSLSVVNKIGAFLVAVWTYLFFLLVLGFGYSYFWGASTIIYFLMRRKVDDTDMDEVYREEDDEEQPPYSTTTPAPGTAAPPAGEGTGVTQMVEAPTLRATSTPPRSETVPTAGDGDANRPS
ncbi:MAG: hypothetical protein NZ700_07375 [Gemmataceae bacterium]|nr:hypothetical protein [Gemmataceae bacterium]MDW8264091.1 hypothetical protein [Gemmataceae bacterium]